MVWFLLHSTMKKLLLYTLISLAVSWNANSKEITTLTDGINKLLDEGYKIINEDTVTRQDSLKFIKTFTLQKRNSSIIICNIKFGRYGEFIDLECTKP